MTFFTHQPLLHGHSCHILPPTTFLSHLHRTKFSPILVSFQQACLENFFVALGEGCTCTPYRYYDFACIQRPGIWWSIAAERSRYGERIDIACRWKYWTLQLLVYGVQSFANWPIVVIASNKCRWFEYLVYWNVQNEVFYRTRIFGNFFFGGGEFCVFEKGIPGGPGFDRWLADRSRFPGGSVRPWFSLSLHHRLVICVW